MKRRAFFRRLAALAVAGAAVRTTTDVPEAREGSPYWHTSHGYTGYVRDDEEFWRIARLLGESARRRQEQIVMSVFNNGFTG